MKNSLISIAMTTYNGEKYLNQQIDSILAQSISDFELIICDDRSSDNTPSILKEYCSKDTRIKVFFNDCNLGFKKNFEKAIKLCNGEYIALCDQDDIWTANHLETLLSNIKDYSMACGNAELINQNNESLFITLNEQEKFLIKQDPRKYLNRIIFYGNCFQGASMLFKKTTLLNYLPIPENVKYHDVWFACCSTLDKGINYTFDIVTKYRQHGDNITFQNHLNYQNRDRFINKNKLLIKSFIKGHKTDRFFYLEELYKVFQNTSESLNEVLFITAKIKKRKSFITVLKWFYRNYFNITTQNSYKNFLHFSILRFHWVETPKP